MKFVDLKKEPDPVHNEDIKIKEEITTPLKNQRSYTHKFDYPDISKDNNNNETNRRTPTSLASLPVSVSEIKSDPVTPLKAPPVTDPLVKAPLVKAPPVTDPLVKAPLVTAPLVKARPVTASTAANQPVTTKAPVTPSVLTTAPTVTAPTVAKQPVTTEALSVTDSLVTAPPVTAHTAAKQPVTTEALSVTAPLVTAPPVTAFLVTTAPPVTAPTVAKQPVTAEASGHDRLVAYKQPGVITVTFENSSSASGIQTSTSTSNSNLPTSLAISSVSNATTSTISSSNVSSSTDEHSRPRVHLKPIRKGQSNANNTSPANRIVWPLYQHVWRATPWTNFSSFNQTSSTQSRKRKASDADDGHQQQSKSMKETAESRPGGAAPISERNCHIAASPGVTGVTDTTVPMLEIHTKTKRKFAVKIRLPSKEYPWVNYPGKLIGIKGSTIKQLERLLRCKLTISGKGCFSTRTWEEQSQEDLHILVECFADTADAYGRFSRAIEILQEFIKSDADPVFLLRSMRFQPSYCSGQVSPGQVSPDWQYWQPNFPIYPRW